MVIYESSTSIYYSASKNHRRKTVKNLIKKAIFNSYKAEYETTLKESGFKINLKYKK